jgi:hypothetical protein
VNQCEITENQAEQNKSHAMAGVEAYPSPPHCCFFCNDRCNLAHADFERGVTECELCPPERIGEVDDPQRKDNARTQNHENSGSQDALSFGNSRFGGIRRLSAPTQCWDWLSRNLLGSLWNEWLEQRFEMVVQVQFFTFLCKQFLGIS